MRVVGKRVSVFVALVVAAGALPASASAAEILSVKNESANFRDGPGDKHPILYSADKFYPVEVVEKKDGWAKVKDFEGDVAWVAERLLTKQETVVVEGDKVNVREKPNTTSEIAFKSERGEVFKVESHQGKWLKVVDANGDGGWIRDDMVWGEKVAAAESPKGKTKGEIEEPSAKPGAAPIPAGDKADKAGKPEKSDKTAEKAGDKASAKPGGDKADKPAKADKPETKPKEGKAAGEKAKAGEKKAEASDDAPAEKSADEKSDAPAEEKADEKSDAGDAPAEKKADDDDAG
jgi:SH3-like domain-containing protein